MAVRHAPSYNIAARMGRWSAQHRKIAIFGWLAFVIAAFVIGNAIGTKELQAAELGVGESGRMMKLLDKEFPERGRARTRSVADSRGDRQGFQGRRRRRR